MSENQATMAPQAQGQAAEFDAIVVGAGFSGLDARTTPIEEITPCGVRTGEREYEVDAIVYATGFDAMTGTLFGMGITGRDGLRLRDKWADGPRTFLGLTAHGFPNLFVITGPQSPSVLSNMPVAIEQNVEWIAGLIEYMRGHDLDVAEPAREAEDKWVAHHDEVAAATLLLGTDSWWVGANIPGKPRTLYPYVGGVGPFRAICHEVAEKGYEGLVLSGHETGGPGRRKGLGGLPPGGTGTEASATVRGDRHTPGPVTCAVTAPR